MKRITIHPSIRHHAVLSVLCVSATSAFSNAFWLRPRRAPTVRPSSIAHSPRRVPPRFKRRKPAKRPFRHCETGGVMSQNRIRERKMDRRATMVRPSSVTLFATRSLPSILRNRIKPAFQCANRRYNSTLCTLHFALCTLHSPPARPCHPCPLPHEPTYHENRSDLVGFGWITLDLPGSASFSIFHRAFQGRCWRRVQARGEPFSIASPGFAWICLDLPGFTQSPDHVHLTPNAIPPPQPSCLGVFV